MESRYAFIGAGSNLGDRLASIVGAFSALRQLPSTKRIASSSIYETVPQGVINQPLYLNAVFVIHTSASPETLLSGLLEIERQFGRVRHERWSARTLDLDLLVFERETRASETLQLPHPRMFERGFVTVPLLELLQNGGFPNSSWAPLLEQLRGVSPKQEDYRLAYPPLH